MWSKTNDYYNREVVSCDVWSKKVPRGKLYLIDSTKDYFLYTFSCGKNSEYSFSGSFFGTTITTLEQAKEYLDKYILVHFDKSIKAQRKQIEMFLSIKINIK